MSDSSWRNHCAPIIAKVLKETKGQTEEEIKAALKAAYPYGQRKHHPYKIWLTEVRNQRAGFINRARSYGAVKRVSKSGHPFVRIHVDDCQLALDLDPAA